MMQYLIKLRRLNLGKEKRLILAILALSTLLATSLFSILVFNTNQAQAQPANTNQISRQVHLIGQVNVRNLPEASGAASNNIRVIPVRYIDPQALAQEKALADSPGFVPPRNSEKIIVSPSTSPTTVSVTSTIEGAPGGPPNPCQCSPPDANLGVGQNQVFEMVNLLGFIYNKDGSGSNTLSLSDFFQLSPSATGGDPQILYDALSGRWFASIIDMSSNSVKFAVSKSGDPRGSWNLYEVSASAYFPDQPFIGVSDDKFVISANDFSGNSFVGAQYWIINKSDLINGALTPNSYTNTAPYFSVHPANHLGSSSGLFYMITVGIGTTSTATLFTVGGVPTATTIPTVTTNSFSIKPMSNPPNAIQPFTGTRLATNDDRVLSAVWENNTLWFSANDACRPSGDKKTRSCARLIQITTSGTIPSKVQDFDYASSGQYFFYPAVSLYQGQLVVVYGRSSSTVYPSLLVTGRAPSDPSSTLHAPLTIRSGTAPDTSTRYGDYFGAATDPTPTASSTFWVAGEYRVSSGFQYWNTAIAQVGAFG